MYKRVKYLYINNSDKDASNLYSNESAIEFF